jgi:hypothetical protein
MAAQQSLHVGQASTVINHLHGGLTVARRGERGAGEDQLPTVYMLDVKTLLRVTAETGLTTIPWRDGEPRAFVLLATRPMREWVEAQIEGKHPLWLPASAKRKPPTVEESAPAVSGDAVPAKEDNR